MTTLSYMRRCLRDPTFSHLSTIPACDGQTDRQTEGHSVYCAAGNKNKSAGARVPCGL